MTLRNAEKISGYEIRRIERIGPGNAFTFAAFDAGVEVMRITGSGPGLTLKTLVEKLYQRTARRVMGEQSWQCFTCARRAPLQIDHVKKRSAGRCDRRFNLRAMCAACHEQRHLHPLRHPRPHPEIVKLMRAAGWEWARESSESEETGWQEIATKTPSPQPKTLPSTRKSSHSTLENIASADPSGESA